MESADKAGLWIPTSGTVFNSVSYFVIHFATQIAVPWSAAFAGHDVVVARPFIIAQIQSLVISAIDHFGRVDNIVVKVGREAYAEYL
ncbi:hypothetical protein [Paraburkholderia humisilvae]|uniref:Uncharacterized protein n=1 Tax=Paraburkholderia humisilvae TaxID=627669 RepID=A0A6J5F3H6_9BURK|nr:hypothetical protein LMG29542_07179 [Paraburkholderia humisilvae]